MSFPTGLKALAMSLLLPVAVAGGCAKYKPMPIARDEVNRRLAVPGADEIRVQAASIKHPILEPVPFDESDGLSPDEAAILAVIANPLLRADRDRKGLAAAQLLQARILPDPRVSYSVEAPVGGGASGKVDAYDLKVDWDVTSLVARGARMDAAHSRARSIDLEVAWKEWQVAEAAKLRVYRILAAAKRLGVAEKMMDVRERSFRVAKRRVESGMETAAGLAAAGEALREARARVMQARAERDTERLELDRILGLPADRIVKLEKGIRPIEVHGIPSVQELCGDIDRRRLDILALRFGYECQEARLRAAVRSQFPKIKIALISARDTDGVQTSGSGVSISIPLFDRNQGRIALEQASRKRLFDEYAARLFEARADVARIEEQLNSTARQIENIDKSIGVIENTAERYRKASDEGRASILDYHRALVRLYEMELDRTALQRRLSDLAIALEVASGRYIFTGDECSRQIR